MSFYLRDRPAQGSLDIERCVFQQTCEHCALKDGMRLLDEVIAADGVFICPRCGAPTPLDAPTVKLLTDLKWFVWEIPPQ